MASIGLTGWRDATARPSRTLLLAKHLARRTASRLAPSVLTIAGLGCIDTGVFTANTVAGWIVTGLSLLVLEFRIDG